MMPKLWAGSCREQSTNAAHRRSIDHTSVAEVATAPGGIMDFEGKAAVVIGGAGGIGLAIVRELLQAGANVAVCDAAQESGDAAVQQLHKDFDAQRVFFQRVDVRSQDEMEAAFASAKQRFKRLDIVVNGAGVFDDFHWEREIDINLKGVVRGSLLAWKHLAKDEGGSGGVVLNIASVLGIDPGIVTPIYSATKHGVVGFSRSLGATEHERRTGVRVVALCPSGTDTHLLREAQAGMLRPDWKSRSSVEVVPPAVVARSALHVLREGPTGSVWVSEGQRTYRVNFRNRNELAEDSH